MTQAPPPTPPIPPANPAAPGPIKKRRRWRRRLAWLAGILFALVCVLRLSVPVLFPAVLRKVCAGYGLDVSYGRSEFNLISGDIGLWYLELRPHGSTQPIVQTGYVRGDLSPLKLFLGKLDLWRVEADGVDIKIDRDENGHIAVLDKLLAGMPAKPVTSSDPTVSQSYDLSPPLKMDALRLTNLKVTLQDHTVRPTLETQAVMNLRVSNVGSLSRPVTFQLDLWSDAMLDSLHVEGEAHDTAQLLQANVHILMRGLRLRPAAPYLATLGIKPMATEWGMQADGMLSVAVTQPAGSLTANAELSGLRVTADGRESAGVDHVSIHVPQLNFDAARISQVWIKGVRADAQRTQTGELQWAGLQWVPIEAAVNRPAKSDAPSSPPPVTTQPAGKFRLTLDEFRLTDLQSRLEDVSFTPAANLDLVVDDLSVRNVVIDPNQPGAVSRITARLHAPGLIRLIQVDGSAAPSASRQTMDLTVTASGIRPDALKPYLEAMGARSDLNDAGFSMKLSAGLRETAGGYSAAAHLDNIRFFDASDLLNIPGISIDDVETNTATGRLRIGKMLISGPVLSAERDPSGVVHVLGLGFGFPVKPAVAASPHLASGGSPKTVSQFVLPRLDIGLIQWTGIKFQFVDRSLSPPSTLSLADAGVELRDLDLDLHSAVGAPGKIKAWLTAPKILDRIDVTGTVTPSPNSLEARVAVEGKGITFAGVGPYLRQIGLESVLQDGRLHADVTAGLRQGDSGVVGAFSLQNATFSDGDKEWLGLDRFEIRNIRLGDEIGADAVQIDRPRITAARDGTGSLWVAGFHTVALPATTAVVTSGGNPSSGRAFSLEAPLPNVVMWLKAMDLNQAGITWTDQSVRPAVKQTASIDAHLDGLVLGKLADPARFSVQFSAPGVVDPLTISGQLLLAPHTQNLSASVMASNIRLDSLAGYLPDGVGTDVKGGIFRAAIDADVSQNPAGGQSASFTLSGVDWRQANSALPMFKLDALKLAASRVDLPGLVVAIDEISDHGLEMQVHKAPDGSIHALGLVLSSAPAATTATAKPTATPTGGMEEENAAAILSRARQPWPLITVDRLDLNVDRIRLFDDTQSGGKPMNVEHLRLANVGRIELAGKDPESRPPMKLEVTGTASPILRSIDLTASVNPFAQQPTLVSDLTLSGINGDGCVKWIPGLPAQVSGNALTEGQFKSHLEATFQLQRRGPYEFNLSHGFDVDLAIKDTAYRARPGGDILLGLKQLQTDDIHITPADGGMTIKSLELTEPIARAYRDADGIHLLGLTARMPEKTATTQPAPDQPETETVPVAATPAKPPTKPSAPIRVDRLLISGLDVEIEDRTCTPPMLIVLNSLDFEARGLSNEALFEDKPISFSALLNSAKTPLPTRVNGALDLTRLEPRETFSQITAAGSVALYPELHGWTKLSINGFELLSVHGLAAQQGVNVGGGTYDGTMDLRFEPDGVIQVRSRHVLTDLQLTEGDDGPIRRLLQLPSPLNFVIGVVQDPDGSITLPADFSIEGGRINGLPGALVGAVSSVLVTAIASAPMKAIGGVGDILGMGNQKEKPRAVIPIPFDAGSTVLESRDLASLSAAVLSLKKDPDTVVTLRNNFGSQDMARAALLANPTIQEAENLAYRLRLRKLQLMQARSEAAGEAQAKLAVLPAGQSADVLKRVDELDRQIAANEDALDNVYDLLRPGADRQATRRTRATALQIGHDRLDAVRSAILASLAFPDEFAQRVLIVNPTLPSGEADGGGAVTITIVSKKR